MEVADEEEDVGAGVGAADADLVEAAVVSEGDDWPTAMLCWVRRRSLRLS
jgi:hypothetical protein